jgi:glycosyltransferase involved in cell wall biosynthesis
MLARVTTDQKRVLHISTTVEGGAGRAMRRLHDGLRRSGWDSRIATGLPSGRGEGTTLLHETGDAIPYPLKAAERLAPRVQNLTGAIRLPFRSTRKFPATELFRSSSIIHLHNLHGGFFDYRRLPAWGEAKPLVWTLHDMWAFTGHCAYSFGCERWRAGCHDCPLFEDELRPLDEIPQPLIDTTRWAWRTKRKTYRQVPLTVAAPSRWLADLAEDSILCSSPASSVHHIPYGLDTDVYHPVDRAMARSMLDIPLDAFVVLAAAASLANERKGMRYLHESLVRHRQPENLCLVTFGGGPSPSVDGSGRALGECSSEHLQAVIYSAADVFVAPSLADNQPLTILESLSCGVPVVAFAVGGIPEIVRHLETGYLAASRDVDDLAEGIALLSRDGELRARLGECGRSLAVERHGLALQAKRYATLYERALATSDDRLTAA